MAYEPYFNLTSGSSSATMSWILLDVPAGFNLNYNDPVFSIEIIAGASVGLGGCVLDGTASLTRKVAGKTRAPPDNVASGFRGY